MNPNNILSRLSAFCKANPLSAIVSGSIIIELLFFISNGPDFYFDTASYDHAAQVLASGEIDVTRTPVYPLLIAFAEFIAGSLKFWIVALVQCVVFTLSIVCFYKIARELKFSVTLSVISTVTYLVLVQLMFTVSSILTEIISVSMSVFLIYYFIRWLHNNNWRYIGLFLLFSILLVFTRPSFVYLAVAVAMMAFLFFFTRQFRRALQMLLCCCVTTGLLLGYCKMMESKTQVFTPSTVTIFNQYVMAHYAGYLRPDNISNPKIKQRVIDLQKRHYQDFTQFFNCNDISIKEFDDELTRLKGDPFNWYFLTFKINLFDFFKAPVVTFYAYPHPNFMGLSNFLTFWQLCIVLLVITVYIVVYWIKFSQAPLFSIFLWLMCVGNIAVNLFGSFGEWSRLFFPSLPLFILLCGELCSNFSCRYKGMSLS